MSTNTFKGRVQNKHKTEEKWILDVYTSAEKTTLRSDPFIPLAGELVIYDPDSTYTYYRFKFGNGKNNVCDLPFVGEAERKEIESQFTNYLKIKDFTDEHFRLKSINSSTNYAYLVGSTDAPTSSDGVITTGSTVDSTYIIPDKGQLHAKGYAFGANSVNDVIMEYDSTYQAIKFVFS